MLWNLIRDFFVQNIFGGTDSLNNQINSLSLGVLKTIDNVNFGKTSNYFVNIGGVLQNGDDVVGITIGDWLSTTATIIVLIALCFFLYLVLRYIFKLFGGLFAH